MYETIGLVWFGVVTFSLLVIIAHDVGINALGFIFDKKMPENRWVYKISKYRKTMDEDDVWFFWGFIGWLGLGMVGAIVWPLSIVVGSLTGFMFLARKMVRGQKKMMQEHVEGMH